MKKMIMALCLMLCLALTGCSMVQQLMQDTDVPVDAVEETIAADETTVAAETEATEKPLAYMVVSVHDAVYEPIPLTEPGRYRITRGDYVNVIEVTEDSMWMAESNCDNQDCVYQGVVSLDNKSERVLQNMILCLPNEVIMELYTYEELLAAYPDWQGGQAQ